MRRRLLLITLAVLTASMSTLLTVAPAGAGTPARGYVAADPLHHLIVVLGARLNADGSAPEILKSRMDTAAGLASVSPATRIIVSGGDTGGVLTEAQHMHVSLLLEHGVWPWQVLEEGSSTDTVSNARNTAALLRSLGASGAVVVTQGWHMERALAQFRSAAPGLTFVPGYAR